MKSTFQNRVLTRLSIITFVCLFYVITSHAERFLAGTLVRTPTAYKPIEALQIDDRVVSHDLKQIQQSSVAQIVHGYTSSFVELEINNSEIVQVAPDHTFYLPKEHKWVEAVNLQEGVELLSLAAGPACVTRVKLIEEPALVYTLSVRDYQTFFVSRQNVLVHNIPLVVSFFAKFGLGAIEICWKKMG